jgi:hypothetical protein
MEPKELSGGEAESVVKAVDLYCVRKADATIGRKFPTLRNTRTVTISELIDDALDFHAPEHAPSDLVILQA